VVELLPVLICSYLEPSLVELFLENLHRFRSGAPLRNEYRADRGY
jgi:hypothetical protein